MQRKTGRAGVLKIIRRGAAVGILAALLFGLLAGVLLPACAKAAQRAPAGTSIKAAKPTQALTFPLAGRCWLSDAYGWREDPFTGDETFHRGVQPSAHPAAGWGADGGGAVGAGTPQKEGLQFPAKSGKIKRFKNNVLSMEEPDV